MMQRDGNLIARTMNTLGCSALLILVCTAFFLSRGIKLAGAVFIALPAAAALGLALLMIVRKLKERRAPKEAERARIGGIRAALSLKTPEEFLDTALPNLCAHYGMERIAKKKALAICAARDIKFAVAALPVPPGAQPGLEQLIAHHSAASRYEARRLVIISNDEAGSLTRLAESLADPEIMWMDPSALAAIPGTWPAARPGVRARESSILQEIFKPSRVKGFWNYGAIMLLLWIFFRQPLLLIFGFLCLSVALVSRVRRAKAVEKNARPFQ